MAKDPLKSIEKSNILNLIYNRLREYPEIKDLDVCFESFDDNKSSIAIFSQQGAVYLKKFITGGYEGFLPFCLIYRSSPKTDKQKMNKIDYLNNLAAWLSNNPPAANDIEIEKLEQTSVPFKDDAEDSGENDYVVLFELTYRKD